jgi:hypothetical protein
MCIPFILPILVLARSQAQTVNNTLGVMVPEYQSGGDMTAYDSASGNSFYYYGTGIAATASELFVGNGYKGMLMHACCSRTRRKYKCSPDYYLRFSRIPI